MSIDLETSADVAVLQQRVEQLEGELTRRSRIEVGREPLTYEARLVPDRNGPLGSRAVALRDEYSYFADITASETMTGNYVAAQERLDRHEDEMKVIGERRQRMFSHEATYEFEERAVSWGTGAGGYFAPPLWLVEQFAIQPTPQRVLSARAPQFELPIGVQSVNLPRWTAGADVDEAQLDSPALTVDVTDAAVQSAVATIAGNADVPMQMLEQSPVGAHLDWAVFSNMEARYGYRLERQLITGTGAATPQGSGNNQLLGILNNTDIPTTNVVSYVDASPTVAEMIELGGSGQGGPLPQAIAAVGDNRLLPPELWLMRTSRAAWIASGEVNFPLALTNMEGPGVFALLAYEAVPDDAIPNTVNGNQDIVIACRPSDWMILESERRTSVFTEVLSGQLMARLQFRRYAAALLRYPSSVAYVTGTGMATPANF